MQASRKPLRDVATGILFVLVATFIAGATGRLEAHLVPDSPSYIDYPLGDLEGMSRSIRTPGYPVVLALLRGLTGGWHGAAVINVLALSTVAFLLSRELRAWGTPSLESWGAAAAIALGCTAMDLVPTVATDVLAAAAGVGCATSLMRYTRSTSRSAVWSAGAVVFCATAAIGLRPAYLFLLPWILVGGCLLHRMLKRPWPLTLKRSGRLMVLSAAPVVAWCALRGLTVGDWGVVPFGGQNLAGVLVQLASDDELQALPPEHRALVDAYIVQRDQWSSTGHFYRGEPMAYMTWEERWHDVTWRALVPALTATAGDNTLTQHRTIQAFNRDFIRQYPIKYVRWYVKALRRAVWVLAADIVMHPIFLASILATVGCLVWLTARGHDWPAVRAPEGWQALTVVALTYAGCKIGFVILTSPPIGRFTDAAAILIPPSLVVLGVSWCRELRRPRSGTRELDTR